MKLNEVIAKYGNQEVDESKIKEVLGVKKSKVWKPEFREPYYFVYEDGICSDRFETSADEVRYGLGNCYQTYEETKFARDKQIFLTKFERYLRENEDEPVDWENSKQSKYYLQYQHYDSTILVDVWTRHQNQGAIHTTNMTALQAFVRENESDIKKYMFGVE